LHFVLPEDAAWMSALSAPRVVRTAARRREQLALSDNDLDKALSTISHELQAGELTRPELLNRLEQSGQATKAGRGYHILAHAAQMGLVYVGPMVGKQQTFGLLANLPVKQRQLEGDEARAELLRRYMHSHGPATLKDFMWWAGMTMAEAEPALAANGSSLACITYNGAEYWLSKESLERAGELPAVPDVLLLAGFDEYILGYTSRQPQLSTEDFTKIVPGANGVFLSTLLLDGRVAGTWRRTLKGGKQPRVDVAFEHFATLPLKAAADLRRQIDQYGTFLGLPAMLQ
jgi:hypothetical protein